MYERGIYSKELGRNDLIICRTVSIRAVWFQDYPITEVNIWNSIYVGRSGTEKEI